MSILLPFLSFAQSGLHLPSSIYLYVDEKPVPIYSAWLDSLIREAGEYHVLFTIVAAHHYQKKSTIKIRLAQTLPKTALFRQVILYYAQLDDEEERERSRLFIYPYFVSKTDTPYVQCIYRSPGKFYFHIHQWKTQPKIQKPTPVEIEIYNEIIKQSFGRVQSMDSISTTVYESVAAKRNKSLSLIKKIFQKVFLWQKQN